VPVVLVLRRSRLLPAGPPGALVMCLAFLLLVRTVDLIPNGFTTPYTLFLAGSLMTFTRMRRTAGARVAGRAERQAGAGAAAAEVTALP